MKTYIRKQKEQRNNPYRQWAHKRDAGGMGRHREAWQAYESRRQMWQEPKKAPWEQSEAIYHIYETGSRKYETGNSVTGLYDTKEGASAARKMHETFKAENSYGNISLGVNKKKEAAFVISQKREHNGPAVKESQKKVHMERKRREVMPNGNIYMNPDLKQHGALAFQAKLSMSVGKALAQIKQYDVRKDSRMLEMRMPYLALDKERRQLKELEECRRQSYERGKKIQAQQYRKQIWQMQSRIDKNEQGEKQMMKKLRDAWQKAKKLSSGDTMMQMHARAGSMRTEDEQIKGGFAQMEDEQLKPDSAQMEPAGHDGKNQSGKFREMKKNLW